ncbi:MAG: hypothetical protein F4Y73_01465, partial [Gemmatimonadetes bacterium]|nr:hypothetical protein [Gemmatimonadota bacterium]
MAVRVDPGLAAEARQLHDTLFVVNGLDASELRSELIPNLRAGGVTANLVTGLRDGVRPLTTVASPHLHFLRDHADTLVHATTVTDIRRARREGRTAIVLGWQRSDYVGEDVDRLLGFHRLGLRSAGLVYNVGNYVGSGCVDPEHGGLSHLGVEVVRELQRLRIVVDIGGHCAEATSFDALEFTTGPVVCSNTNPRALRPGNPRTMTDG